MNLTQHEFDVIRQFVHLQSGLALAADKQYLILTRLKPVAERHGLRSFAEIINRLQDRQNVAFRDEVVEALLTNETSFNRDVHPFDELRRVILPQMVELLKERKLRSGLPFPRIRIWSVAASTGQEPYSIAMAILDFLQLNSHTGLTAEHFWILASDISEKSLQIARTGVYWDREIERGVTPDQKLRYFAQHGQQWIVTPAVRKLVEFRRVNVLQNIADLSGFDLVFCRNLLIYFDEPARILVCRKLADSMNPDGILLLGSSEGLPANLESTFRQKLYGRTVGFVKVR